MGGDGTTWVGVDELVDGGEGVGCRVVGLWKGLVEILRVRFGVIADNIIGNLIAPAFLFRPPYLYHRSCFPPLQLFFFFLASLIASRDSSPSSTGS